MERQPRRLAPARQVIVITAVAIAVIVADTRRISAQTPAEPRRAFIDISGALQPRGQDITESISFPAYGTTGTVTTSRHLGGGRGLIDVSAGVILWRGWGAGLSVGHHTILSMAEIVSTVPSPSSLLPPRVVTESIGPLKFSEAFIAPLAVYRFPSAGRLEVIGFAGPAIRTAKTITVTDARVIETLDGPALELGGTVLLRSFTGARAGVDLRYAWTRALGVGGFVRVTTGAGALSDQINLRSPGMQIGGGLRVGF